jgi:hypothetical protein
MAQQQTAIVRHTSHRQPFTAMPPLNHHYHTTKFFIQLFLKDDFVVCPFAQIRKTQLEKSRVSKSSNLCQHTRNGIAADGYHPTHEPPPAVHRHAIAQPPLPHHKIFHSVIFNG